MVYQRLDCYILETLRIFKNYLSTGYVNRLESVYNSHTFNLNELDNTILNI